MMTGIKNEIIVLRAVKECRCVKCGAAIHAGNMARAVKGGSICLKCAGLCGLVFLASGSRAMTVRAKKNSARSAVVFRWDSRWKRYQRQGLLVAPGAVKKAEILCEDDRDKRRKNSKKAAIKAQAIDLRYRESFAAAILEKYPGCGAETAKKIAFHACEKHSGRVGRSAAAKKLCGEPITLAVKAFVRHNMTGYDGLFLKGLRKQQARDKIRDQVEIITAGWRQPDKHAQDGN